MHIDLKVGTLLSDRFFSVWRNFLMRDFSRN